MQANSEELKKVGDLIASVKMAMLTTMEQDGTLRSRPMATQKAEFNGELWFFTRASAPKVEEIEEQHKVNVSYAEPDKNIYVSVSGQAKLVRDAAKAKELWNPLLKAWFPQGLEDPEIALLCVRVEQAEYWDSPSSTMVQVAGFVKAIATGKPYQSSPGEHAKVTL